ncbi:MAG: hypothetical protein ABIQ31_22160 [Ferruginibacter sp.]
MDITPYQIAYWNGSLLINAEVKPCCSEDNVVDYAIYKGDQLSFNITKNETGKWVISLKNADKEIDDEVVQSIGMAIDQHNRQ